MTFTFPQEADNDSVAKCIVTCIIIDVQAHGQLLCDVGKFALIFCQHNISLRLNLSLAVKKGLKGGRVHR